MIAGEFVNQDVSGWSWRSDAPWGQAQ